MRIQDVIMGLEICKCPLTGEIPKGMNAVKIQGGIKKSIFSEFSIHQLFSRYAITNLVDFLKENNKTQDSPSSVTGSETIDQSEVELLEAQQLVTMLMLACCQAINQNAADSASGRVALWNFKLPALPAINTERFNDQPEVIHAYLNGCTQETLNEGISHLNQYLEEMKSNRNNTTVPAPNSDIAFLTGLSVDKITPPKAIQFVFGQVFVAGAKNAKGLTNPLTSTAVVSLGNATPVFTASTSVSNPSAPVLNTSLTVRPVGNVTTPAVNSEDIKRSQEIKTQRERELSTQVPARANRDTTISSLETSLRQLVQDRPAILAKQVLEKKLAASVQTTAAFLAYKQGREAEDAQQRAAALAAALAAATSKPKTPAQIARERAITARR